MYNWHDRVKNMPSTPLRRCGKPFKTSCKGNGSMIEFTKRGPVKVNKKCEKCTEKCKQHLDVKIIACRSFKPVE